MEGMPRIILCHNGTLETQALARLLRIKLHRDHLDVEVVRPSATIDTVVYIPHLGKTIVGWNLIMRTFGLAIDRT